MRISDWSSDVCSSDLDVGEEPVSLAPGRKNFIGSGVAEHGLDRAEQRFANMRIMFGQDLEPDMLLVDSIYCGGQSRKIVDVTGISENGPGESPRLRPRISMIRRVEQVADLGVFEHARVLFVVDVEACCFG